MTYYTDAERIASNRFSIINARVTYKLDNYWKRSDFIKWFSKQNQCFYCETSIEDLGKFYDLDNSKRKATRGRTLEVDRIKDTNYTEENCVAACYWCNNAKSDVFSEKEFKEIGMSIGKTIQHRINNKTTNC